MSSFFHVLLAQAEPNAVEPLNFGQELMKMLGTLALFLGALVIGAWLLKRAMNSRLQAMNEGSSIKVLEQRTLSPKSVIYVLEVYGQGLVVGETPQGLHSLGALKTKNFEQILEGKDPCDRPLKS